MSLTDISTKERESKVGRWLREEVHRGLLETEQSGQVTAAEQGRPGISSIRTSEKPVIPEIKGLEALKEGVHWIDLEKTISDMIGIMKNMEANLEKVLLINGHLERDLKASKETVVALNAEKSRLEGKIANLEQEIPSKRELQIEADHLILERNSAQGAILKAREELDKARKSGDRLQKRVADLEEEKRDAIGEIQFLEASVNSSSEKIQRYHKENNTLKGQKLVQAERIKALDQELKECVEQKFELYKELKETKQAVEEARTKLAETKLQASRSFYTGSGEAGAAPETAPA